MKSDLKRSVSVALMVACSATASVCLAANPEEDAAIQAAGKAYNQNVDAQYGYPGVDVYAPAEISDNPEAGHEFDGMKQLPLDDPPFPDDEDTVREKKVAREAEEDYNKRIMEMRVIEAQLDASVQAAGLAYNRRYDMEHGYSVTDVNADSSVQAIEPETAPAPAKVSRPVAKPADTAQAVTQNTRMITSAVPSNAMQDKGQEYNKKYDMKYEPRQASVTVSALQEHQARQAAPAIVAPPAPVVQNIRSAAVEQPQPRIVSPVDIQSLGRDYNNNYDRMHGHPVVMPVPVPRIQAVPAEPEPEVVEPDLTTEFVKVPAIALPPKRLSEAQIQQRNDEIMQTRAMEYNRMYDNRFGY